jgi:hypothetical protein
MYRAFRLQHEIGQTVSCQNDYAEVAMDIVYQSSSPTYPRTLKFCEKCHREVAIGIDRNAPR